MNELERKRLMLQNTMNFAASLAYGMEQLAGRGANGMTYVAGRKLGKQLSENATHTEDLGQALREVEKVLAENHFEWKFEPFKLASETDYVVEREDGSRELKLVFRDCMIRQSLFCFGHKQKGSLCYMMYGFFAGALENIMDRKATLDIDHAGDNACLKTLRVENSPISGDRH